MKSSLAGLYYPFSRCIQPTSLKQLLLVFDEVTFVDPVDDAQWRAKLFADLESYDAEFAPLRVLAAAEVNRRLVHRSSAARRTGSSQVHSFLLTRQNEWR